MKKLLLFISILIITGSASAAIDTVRNNGNNYTPENITITAGDTVVWLITNSHNVVEVDSTTWAANGTTSNNGFSLPFGGGSEVFSTAGKYFYVCTPHAVVGMKGTITVLPSSTSIPEEQLGNQFSFYPNPATEQLTVEIPRDEIYETIEVVNELGQIVFTQQITSKKELINLSQFVQGIYFVNLRSNNAVLTRKLIIE